MPSTASRLLPAVGLSFVAICLLAACDNSVDPFVASDNEPFAIYGYLDTEADTQFVRISPVIDASGFVYEETLHAVVSLHDLTTESAIQMNDSSAVLPDGRRAYFYYTELTPQIGADYRLDVSHPDGTTTSALASMPDAEQVSVQDPVIENGNTIIQVILWQGVSSIRNLEIEYVVAFGSSTRTVSLPYAAPRLTEPDITTIDLHQDRERVLSQLPPGTSGVRLLRVGASAELLSPEWELGYDPGQIFFASIGRVHQEWTLPDSIVTRLGYVVPGS